MSGFVYIWYDRKHKRFYIGSHWGPEDDGYVCSSQWMRRAYDRRPHDFKRRILVRGVECKRALLQEENRWLQMTKPSEIKTRYYNLHRHNTYHWLNDPDRTVSVKEKISRANIVRMMDPREREKIAKALRGRKLSEEIKAKIGKNSSAARDYDCPEFRARMAAAGRNRSEETRAKISENNRRLHVEGRIGMAGRRHSEETRARMRAAQEKYPRPDDLERTMAVMGQKRAAAHYGVSRSVVKRWIAR